MKLFRVLLLASMALTLQGCWIIFIPGSVVGAVSDAITGSEGDNCVGQSAKVGQIVKFADGGFGTIKSLSGTSSRCTDPIKPIRALIVGV